MPQLPKAIVRFVHIVMIVSLVGQLLTPVVSAARSLDTSGLLDQGAQQTKLDPIEIAGPVHKLDGVTSVDDAAKAVSGTGYIPVSNPAQKHTAYQPAMDNWQYNGGDARLATYADAPLSEGAIILTEAQAPWPFCTIHGECGYETGSAWNTQKIDLNQSFSKTFIVYLGNRTSVQGGDGMVFTLQNDVDMLGAVETNVNNGTSLGFEGISPSIGAEIDTYIHSPLPGNDIDHITIVKNGSLSQVVPQVPACDPACEVEDGNTHILRVDWEAGATTQTLSVYFDGQFRTSHSGDLISTI